MNNKRKVVWITGASSGIGAELARQYSNFGVKLILSSRRADVLEKVKSECSNSENIKILPFDLIDFKSMSKLVKSAYEFFGTIDVLINNAGVSQRSLIIDTELLDKYLNDNNISAVKTASGLRYDISEEGSGPTAPVGSSVKVHYTGMLLDGTKFDSSLDRNQPIEFVLGQGRVIKGWDEGISYLKVGGKATFIIPSNLAYGERGAGGVIPPNATCLLYTSPSPRDRG